MQSFSVYNPTKLYFGKGVTQNIGQEIAQRAKNILILIGKGSVKQNGVLASILDSLNEYGLSYTIVEGIKSNPEHIKADEAIALAKSIRVDGILGIGGGSVIDTAKAVSMGYYHNGTVWDLYQPKAKFPEQALPLFVVLTLAATGTEMNKFTVLQNNNLNQKNGFGHDLLYPKIAYLDPSFTVSVPANYTAYGIADLIAHTLEQYFSKDISPLSDAFALQLLKQAFEVGLALMKDLNNETLRAQTMWLATVALNGTLMAGKKNGDWGVHAFEHVLSALYDIPHGAGLSILYPGWLKHFEPELLPKIKALDQVVPHFGSNMSAIERLKHFFDLIGTPTSLSQVGIYSSHFEKIIEVCTQNRVRGVYYDMNQNDYRTILNLVK